MGYRHRLVVGDTVKVRFGRRQVEATVTEIRGERVFVQFAFEETEDSVRLGYSEKELQSA